MTEATITIRFFARLRESLATDELTVTVNPDTTAGDLLEQLARRGDAWHQLNDGPPVMIAVNHTMARRNTPIRAGDEVAFFPPVTGG